MVIKFVSLLIDWPTHYQSMYWMAAWLSVSSGVWYSSVSSQKVNQIGTEWRMAPVPIWKSSLWLYYPNFTGTNLVGLSSLTSRKKLLVILICVWLFFCEDILLEALFIGYANSVWSCWCQQKHEHSGSRADKILNWKPPEPHYLSKVSFLLWLWWQWGGSCISSDRGNRLRKEKKRHSKFFQSLFLW